MTLPDRFASAQAAQFVHQADFFAGQRDWNAAEQLFRKALSLDTSAPTRIAFGVCLAEQERYFEAISLLTPILDGTDRSAIGVVCHNLASIYREVGDFDLARRFQWRATLLQEHSCEEDLLGMANDALASQHPEIAASLVMTALEMKGNSVDDDSDGDLIATTGLVKAILSSPEDGLITVFAAYRRHQADSDYRGMGADLMNMAVLFGDVDRHRAERSCLVRAIRCFERASATHSRQKAQQQLDRFDRKRAVRSFDPRRN